MARQKKSLTILMVLLFGLVSFSIYSYACIKYNGSEDAFDEGSEETGDTVATPQARLSGFSSIAALIVNGAGHFLESHSSYLAFLKKYEMSEVNGISREELAQALDNAISAMENAIITYGTLKSTADQTPYRYDVYWKLVLFNYNAFQYNRGLNRDVFSRVARYLSYGDVRGCYEQSLENCRDILARLKYVKESFEIGEKSSLNNIWRLSQKYSDSLLFGQYIAEVFYEIK